MGSLVDLAKGAAQSEPEQPEPERPAPVETAASPLPVAIHGGNLACDGCNHIRMVEEQRNSNPRRFFWFRCAKGHAIIEAGYHGERVLLAPASCTDHDATQRH